MGLQGILQLLARRDYEFGRIVCHAAQESAALRTIATVASLSCDEAVWFPLPAVLAVSHALLGWGADGTGGFLAEVQGDIFMCCMVEVFLKFCFQRTRPTYAAQASFYVLVGEWWSFPSGHSLRSAYLARRAAASPDVLRAVFGTDVAIGQALLMWVLLVAWSRAAKGRHFPADVAIGLLIGVILAEAARAIGPWRWGVAKLLVGSASSMEVAILLARPEWQAQGFVFHLGCQVSWWLSQPFGFGVRLSLPWVFALSSTITALGLGLGRWSRKNLPAKP